MDFLSKLKSFKQTAAPSSSTGTSHESTHASISTPLSSSISSQTSSSLPQNLTSNPPVRLVSSSSSSSLMHGLGARVSEGHVAESYDVLDADDLDLDILPKSLSNPSFSHLVAPSSSHAQPLATHTSPQANAPLLKTNSSIGHDQSDFDNDEVSMIFLFDFALLNTLYSEHCFYSSSSSFLCLGFCPFNSLGMVHVCTSHFPFH